MSFKKVKVVMLPTNEKAIVGSIVTRPSDNRMAIVNVLTINDPQPRIHQHLYFLSDEEIKQGDWILDIKNPIKPRQIKTKHLLEDLFDTEKKIIATTDNSLIINSIYGIDSFDASIFSGSGKSEMIKLPQMFNLPQPSQSFIEKYIEEYNKSNHITEVMVEYEFGSIAESYFDGNTEKLPLKLKVNPKDNTITIRKVKEIWSKEEVAEKLKKAMDFAYHLKKSDDAEKKCNEWIEKNL